ncbi:MAG TPA: histidine phosphatase family protein, partial [Verrucomicrobiae bacterium]
MPLVLLGFIGTVRAEDAETVANTNAVANAPTQTIVCIRHGEKPKRGLGQLTPRGLNRALALPDVLLARYGKPQYIFAPNPTEKVDGKPGYYYVRPLTTIEPTAIKCGLPVNTQFGYTEIKALENELNKTNYQN